MKTKTNISYLNISRFFEKYKVNLKENGFIIIKTADLINRFLDQKDDVIEDNLHPSPKAWEEITPKLIKELEKLK